MAVYACAEGAPLASLRSPCFTRGKLRVPPHKLRTLHQRVATVSLRSTGTPLEACNASVGTLLCEERPVYGGSGQPALNGTRFDEAGYTPHRVWRCE